MKYIPFTFFNTIETERYNLWFLRQAQSSDIACYITSSVSDFYTQPPNKELKEGVVVFKDSNFSQLVSSSYISNSAKWYYISGSDGIITQTGSCGEIYNFYYAVTSSFTSSDSLEVEFTSFSVGDELTINTWIKDDGLSLLSTPSFYGFLTNSIDDDSIGLSFLQSGSDYHYAQGVLLNESSSIVTNSSPGYPDKQWVDTITKTEPIYRSWRYADYMVMHTLTLNNNTKEILQYANGVLIGSGSFTTSSYDIKNPTYLIKGPGVTPGQGKVYSRVLSAEEISQSFEDTKSTYAVQGGCEEFWFYSSGTNTYSYVDCSGTEITASLSGEINVCCKPNTPKSIDGIGSILRYAGFC